MCGLSQNAIHKTFAQSNLLHARTTQYFGRRDHSHTGTTPYFSHTGNAKTLENIDLPYQNQSKYRDNFDV